MFPLLLVNNLITTTTTEKPKVTNHPLLGLMDLSSYTPPANSTVETYGGHSRVSNSNEDLGCLLTLVFYSPFMHSVTFSFSNSLSHD